MNKIYTHSDVCSQCEGNGYCDISPDGKKFPPLSPWGAPGQTQVGCEKCGGNSYSLGSGRQSESYVVSDALCTECLGAGYFEQTQVKNSMDHSGRGWRENVVTRTACSSCLGQKKKLHRVETFPCHTCLGLGTVGKWKKPLFPFLSGKGQMEVMHTCPACQGKGTEKRQEVFAHGVGSPK